MSLQPIVARLVYTSNTQHPTTQYNRRSHTLGLVALLCCLLFLLAACGPERGASESDLTADAIRIAQEYEQNGDLNGARVQLQNLEAANPTQWLIYLAETRVSQEPGAAETNALVGLAMALGLQSRPLVDYATQHNLLVNAPLPTMETVAQAGMAPIALAPVTSTENNAEAGAPATPAPAGEPDVITDAVTPTVAAPEVAATPTQPPVTDPMAQASTPLNVRGGPGTAYTVVGALDPGTPVEITGKNPQSDWWQVLLPTGQQGWVYAPLVQTAGDTSTVAVAANIPEPPPTATPAPVVEAPPPDPAQQPPAEQPPAEQPPAEGEPADQPPAEEQPAPPPSDNPHFTLVEKRLWSKQENGGCVGQHLLRIHVLDANGNRLNGVALQGIYIGEIIVTGSQGKGDGIIEYDLHGSGEGFRVIRDADGREATSDPAEGFTTRSIDISQDLLIQAGYCTNDEDCQVFYNSYGCHGHHSWEATFKRNY